MKIELSFFFFETYKNKIQPLNIKLQKEVIILDAITKFIEEYPAVKDETLKELKKLADEKNWVGISKSIELLLNKDFDEAMDAVKDSLKSDNTDEKNIATLLWAQPAIFFIILLADSGGIKDERDIVLTILTIFKNLKGIYEKAAQNVGYMLTSYFLDYFTRNVEMKNIEEAIALILLAKEASKLTGDEKLMGEIEKIISELG